MKLENPIIENNILILPRSISRTLRWKYPFHKIPRLEEYNKEIVEYARKNNKLPFYIKFDINNDGRDEIILIQKSIIGGFGRILIISMNNDKLKFDEIEWRRPMNALYFDYLIDKSLPRNYQKKDLLFGSINDTTTNSKEINVSYPHIVTKGYNTRIVYWDGKKYCQEKISMLNN